MFILEMHNTDLYINTFRMTDLRKPFQSIIGKDQGIQEFLRSPSESLSRHKKPLTYYVPFTPTRAGAMYHSEVEGLKCHWVYNTNASVSPLFRDKALSSLFRFLDYDEKPYKEMQTYLKTVVSLLWKSYDFDCIVTSIEKLHLLVPDTVPVKYIPLFLKRISSTRQPTSRNTMLKAILAGHPEGIPLSLLAGRSLRNLSLQDTNYTKTMLQGYKKLLIVEGTNTSYAGFLAREFRFLGIREALPTCIFHINQ